VLPVPEHDKEKDFVPDEVNVTVSLPDVPFVPVHVPEAEHEVELEEVHEIVIESPTETALSDAVKLTIIDGTLGLIPPPPPPPPQDVMMKDKITINVFLKDIFKYYQSRKFCPIFLS
jgi:hypothetical protein